MHFLRHPWVRWSFTLILLTLVVYQLWVKSDHFRAFSGDVFNKMGGYVVLVICLMPVNWWLETHKWKQFLSRHVTMPFSGLLRAVMGGVALSLFTPNRIGEYGGRILFMPYPVRWQVAIATMMGSISQNLVAFVIGAISLALLIPDMLWLKITLLAGIIIACMCFFRIKQVVRFVCRLKLHPVFKKVIHQLIYIEDYGWRVIWKGLGLALTRYLVYTFQFVILLHAFEPDVSIGALFIGVCGLYLFHTLIPLPPVADVLARTNIALIIWSGSGMSELSISLASLLVWTVNLLIPAVIGSIALSTINPENSLHSHDQHLSPVYEPVIADHTASASQTGRVA